MPVDRVLRSRRRQTKIVATIGPSSAGATRVAELVAAGVDVFRINTAHGARGEHDAHVDTIRSEARRAARPVGILVDLAGPKIRLGKIHNDELQLAAGDRVRFVRSSPTRDTDLVTTYAPLVDELETGGRLMLADGTVALEVNAVDHDSATCTVVQPGIIRSGQGVNLPGLNLGVPTLDEEDREHAVWAAKKGADFIGISFVRSVEDVVELRKLLDAHGSEAQVIAKIEKQEALDDLHAIVRAADGIMVARGDLGVEIDIARVPVVQKRIVLACRHHRKPVIVATQMLDSMQKSRLPTRAEATDVANAILDGADACMLSGETAIGRYPVESVEMMDRIAAITEERGGIAPARADPDAGYDSSTDPEDVPETTLGVARAAGELAESVGAKLIMVASKSGLTARSVSHHRHRIPTAGVSESQMILQRMSIYWGVHPLPDCPMDSPSKILEFVVDHARRSGDVVAGDRVVMVSGTGLKASKDTSIVVHEID
jgi:pyruvate kinase